MAFCSLMVILALIDQCVLVLPDHHHKADVLRHQSFPTLTLLVCVAGSMCIK